MYNCAFRLYNEEQYGVSCIHGHSWKLPHMQNLELLQIIILKELLWEGVRNRLFIIIMSVIRMPEHGSFCLPSLQIQNHLKITRTFHIPAQQIRLRNIPPTELLKSWRLAQKSWTRCTLGSDSVNKQLSVFLWFHHRARWGWKGLYSEGLFISESKVSSLNFD